MPTLSELQDRVDRGFPQAVKIVMPDGYVFLAPYLVVTSDSSLDVMPLLGGVQWVTLEVPDMAAIDWMQDTVTLPGATPQGSVTLNRNFSLADVPKLQKAVAEERKYVQDNWVDALRERAADEGLVAA